jgi:hypothetical protein
MAKVNLDQAVRGLMHVERRILALAAERRIPGFKIEWNEDLDFGHLMDPVPVALLVEGARVDGKFSLTDLAQSSDAQPTAVGEEIDRLVNALAATPHSGPPLHDPPGAP